MLYDPWRSENRDLKFLRMYGVPKNIENSYFGGATMFGRHVPHESQPKDPLIAKNKNETFCFQNLLKRKMSEFVMLAEILGFG